ncbi:MAG: Hint domain-containing protein [Albidovulum sp.]
MSKISKDSVLVATRHRHLELTDPVLHTQTSVCPHTPCFTAGSEIATDCGPVCVEDLRLGDRVLTRDHGYKTIQWIGARHFSAKDLKAHPQLRPMIIRAGAFGQDMPLRDLTVSPQHRMLVTGQSAELGATEVLAAAVDLCCAVPATQSSVTYYHIMFDSHEIVSSNGCWSESFLPEAAAMDGLHSAQRTEILSIFPELATDTGREGFAPARVVYQPEQAPAVHLAA